MHDIDAQIKTEDHIILVITMGNSYLYVFITFN